MTYHIYFRKCFCSFHRYNNSGNIFQLIYLRTLTFKHLHLAGNVNIDAVCEKYEIWFGKYIWEIYRDTSAYQEINIIEEAIYLRQYIWELWRGGYISGNIFWRGDKFQEIYFEVVIYFRKYVWRGDIFEGMQRSIWATTTAAWIPGDHYVNDDDEDDFLPCPFTRCDDDDDDKEEEENYDDGEDIDSKN